MVAAGNPLTINVFITVISFKVISKSTKHVPLTTLYTTVPALTQSVLMVAFPEYGLTIPFPIKLVLNTVIKMQKNEFCLNFYTAVLNTNYEVLFNKAKNINIEQEDITATCDALMDGMYNFSAGPSSPYLPTINVYIGLVLKISDNTIRIVAYRSDSTEKPYYKIKSGGVWKNIWFQ